MTEIYDNRYEIKSRLGSGGMADVYLAHDTHLNRDVAIKILYKRYASDAEFVARFQQEAKSAARLNHPHIVSIYDRGEADGSYYIAMEYLQGKSLKELIAEKGLFPPDKAIFVTEQILEALQFAHEHDVVHRDIKPANIVVNGRGQVKVTDFGIARAGSSARMTETGSIIGTAQYLSPEQAKGKAVGQSSDLYSLGVVLYEMLTGRVPFEGENPVAIALKHISDIPVPPQALVPELPDNLNNVVMKALAKNPADRYASAREFLADLERCRRDQTVAMAPVSEGATQVIPAVAAPAATGAPTTARPAAAGGPPAKKTRKGKIFLIVLLAALALAAVAVGVYLLAFQGKAVAVPDVVNMTRQQAEDTLRGAGFKTEVEAEEYSESVPQGSVIRQDPAAGEKLREGGTVRLIISRGSGDVAVPDLVGQTAGYAESKLQELELRGDRQPDAYSDTVPEGSIISQDPAAGTEVQKGSTVKYTVSKGSEPAGDTEVPDLEGMTQSEAQTALNAKKLVLGSVSEDYSDSVPAGRVMSQSPAAGQKIPEGSTVNITLSLGPEPSATVPDVIGDTQAAAEAAITAEGLVPAVVNVVDPLNAGKVVDQSPAAMTTVAPGSTVTITVATTP
ncbi:MAG: Stk1 family PASTA domain-containing Ser/Thr kinase [Gaiellales bacterium]|nr:MAG: Stk1 family PASTA domain-containing Ser/Thr kinase [Gaiellales bacterium]